MQPRKRTLLKPHMKELHLWIVGFIIMRRIEYQKGEQIGNCIYLKESSAYISPSLHKNRKALFQCKCGDVFEAVISQVKRGCTTSCGCENRRKIAERFTIHGLRNHPLYHKWNNMIQRCFNPNYKQYNDYGGRGITVCDEWGDDLQSYFDYVISLPNAMKPGLTIDRIRNNEGYKPGNLRWTTKHIQQANQRKYKNNTSGFTGVQFDKINNKWVSRIRINYELISLGSHFTINQALKARNNYIIENDLTEYQIQ